MSAASVLTDVDLLREHRRALMRRNLAERTIRERERQIAAFARWFAPRSVLEASDVDIEDYLDTRRVGPRGRYLYLSHFATFFGWAVRAGHVASNPAKDIPKPKIPRLVPRPVATGDLIHAIGGAPPMMAAWLALGAYQGLRCQEIANVRREDVLLDRDDPALIVSKPKGGRQRVLPLNVHTEAALRCAGLPEKGYLFTSSRGRPFASATVSGYIRDYLHGVGVRASAHQLRHLFGTTIYNATRDIRIVQEMLGHADVSTTAIYVAINPHDAAAVMREMTYTDPIAASEPHVEDEGDV